MPRQSATTWLTPEDVEVTVTPTPTGYKVECEYTYRDHCEVERRYARTKKHAQRLARQFHERAAENGRTGAAS